MKTSLKFLLRFTNEKSLAQHTEEHASAMANELVESKNNSSQLTPSTQDVAKKEDKKTGKLDSPNATNAGGEVKATCPQCGQTFRRKFNMTIHIDRVETVYPYLSHLNL